MGDTPRSQTISTKTQKIAAKNACELKQATPDPDCPPVLVGETSLVRIRMLAEREPDMVFTSLVHRIDLSLLRQSFKKIRKSDTSGVDEMTASEYAENLDENLYKLYRRLKRGQYVATPVKRIWIDKDGGEKRPIGIPALEDKIVQKAVAEILAAVYEPIFYEFSHGFRKGYSQHGALKQLRDQCIAQKVNWIVSADIRGLFDNIEHGQLRDIIKRRVNDGGILRLIGKWLNAGVIEGDTLIHPEKGTPQGGVISPVLSNIFLHYVLDDWYDTVVAPRMKGGCFLIRYADDFIIGCEYESDTQRIMKALPKRFNRFGLSLHPQKTKVIPFGKPRTGKKGKGTFDFLGFTFYWGKTLKNYYVIKKKTARKRLNRFMRMLWAWCKKNRHEAMVRQYEILCSKLRGFYQYYGVRGNYKALEAAFEYAVKAWYQWLRRRSSRSRLTYEMLRGEYPLPSPKIVHNI